MNIEGLSRNKTSALDVGTVLVYKKGNTSDSYIIGWDALTQSFLLISLSCFHVVDKWESIELASDSLTIERNGFVLTDIVAYKDLEMRRVKHYEDWQSKN